MGAIHAGEDHIIAAIDLGTTKVAVLIAQVNSTEILIKGIGAASHDGLRRGILVDPDTVASALTEAVIKARRMAALPFPDPVVGIPGIYVSLFTAQGSVAITRPQGRIHPEDIERVIEGARARAVPLGHRVLDYTIQSFVVDGAQMDRAPLGTAARQLGARVQFVTMAAPIWESYQGCMAKAGLQPRKLTVQSVAIAHSTLTWEEQTDGVVLVDVGAGLTDFVLYRGTKLQHMGALPVGTESFVQDLVVGLHLLRPEAELLLWSVGITGDGVKGDAPIPQIDSAALNDFAQVAAARAEEIWILVRAEISKANSGYTWPRGIRLAGGGALIPGFRELGEQVTGLSVELVPTVNIAGLPASWQNPRAAACVGLIMHQAAEFSRSSVDIKKPSAMDVPWQKIRTWFGF